MYTCYNNADIKHSVTDFLEVFTKVMLKLVRGFQQAIAEVSRKVKKIFF